ncbi:MAG: hypothetical protein QOF87_2864 [Pseudonocardiales bacterium]|jgi:hypothetical protein|nr:hypothetical protein [Pseudonocardiales bacterium]MDT4956589.1 hypothetical protein [Pseudonocardiales bacterium]MDT4963217.1 hypothetical protein [Pseudonocardiales bacterium]MDT4973436.1 hypothetical protein [Pseudonocardiales bacterium]
MDSLATAMIMAQPGLAHEALSARPHAPVLPYVEKVPVTRTRQTVAGALRHLADVVAPSFPAGHPSR